MYKVTKTVKKLRRLKRRVTRSDSVRRRVVGVDRLLAPLSFARMNITAAEPILAIAPRCSAKITTFRIEINRWHQCRYWCNRPCAGRLGYRDINGAACRRIQRRRLRRAHEIRCVRTLQRYGNGVRNRNQSRCRYRRLRRRRPHPQSRTRHRRALVDQVVRRVVDTARLAPHAADRRGGDARQREQSRVKGAAKQRGTGERVHAREGAREGGGRGRR